ncbi:hypothetical protein HAX54_051157 [Datura stramonium]|uniref:ACT domain-containing protein ACR n=1 Tax=Datura stramonium TaxID=4076 RepID=A0ABS8SXE0_DATST|nr:hypothetical protein [Datura stramonium]
MIDNASCSNATLVMIDSARKHGILLEAVQVLTDLNTPIKKLRLLMVGGLWMSLGAIHYASSKSYNGLTALELTGTDRIGLLSESLLYYQIYNANVVEASVDSQWTVIMKESQCFGLAMIPQLYQYRTAWGKGLLRDIQYVVFHATINSAGDRAYLEFFIRHTDGSRLVQAEKQRVILCLQAGIVRKEHRRCSDRFRDRESVRQKIGWSNLKVKELPLINHQEEDRDEPAVGVGGAMLLSLGSIFRRNLYNLGLIKSFS